MLKIGYIQSNADHTLLYKHATSKVEIIIVYVDEFEVKDLGQLKYFLGIEISRGPKGMFLSQRKYVLDLLKETGMLGCRLAATSIEKNYRLRCWYSSG
jgi:hypothetical protein